MLLSCSTGALLNLRASNTHQYRSCHQTLPRPPVDAVCFLSAGKAQLAPPPGPSKAVKEAPRTKSFTLALLLHRWHTECNPRLQACLQRRFDLMNITLLGALMHGKWMPHDDMGHKLVELREG